MRVTDASKGSLRAEQLRKIETEIGRETLTLFMALSPESRKVLLDLSSAPDQPRKKGGRPKGSGTDYSAPLRRMAELQVDNPDLKNWPAARQVAAEIHNPQAAERLRKLYGENREALLDAERKRREPKRVRRIDAPGSLTEIATPSLATRVEQELERLLRGVKEDALAGLDFQRLTEDIFGYQKSRDAMLLDIKRSIEAHMQAGLSPAQAALAENVRQLQLASPETWHVLRDIAAEIAPIIARVKNSKGS